MHVYTRLSRWAKQGLLERISAALQRGPARLPAAATAVLGQPDHRAAGGRRRGAPNKYRGDFIEAEYDEDEAAKSCECSGACPCRGADTDHSCESDGKQFWRLPTVPRRCHVHGCGGEVRSRFGAPSGVHEYGPRLRRLPHHRMQGGSNIPDSSISTLTKEQLEREIERQKQSIDDLKQRQAKFTEVTDIKDLDYFGAKRLGELLYWAEGRLSELELELAAEST